MTQPVPAAESAEDALLSALTEVIRGASTPEIQQAQALLLRRLALEGSVIPSRIPAPASITEVGGYFNLLTDLRETEMRSQMLGAALGLAGSNPASGWSAPAPPMTLAVLGNDRPPVDDGSVPTSVRVRSDLAPGLQGVRETVHALLGLLPLWSPPPGLPPAGGGDPDPMPFLGRSVLVAPTAATTVPETDPVILGRLAGDPADEYRLGVKVRAGSAGAVTDTGSALLFHPVAQVFVARDLPDTTVLPLSAAVAGSGWTVTADSPVPAGRGDYGWAKITSPAGLVPGSSRLGDELALLYPSAAIAASAFAARVDYLWDGRRFGAA
jgi:hypothetical protein